VTRSAPLAEPPVPPVRLGEDDGRRAILVDGVVQSIALDHGAAEAGYWAAMLPDTRPSRALLLGYGGGTLAHLLLRRFGPLPIVGVDDDPRVLALAPALLEVPACVELVCLDALAYVQGTVGRFDYVAVDLFRGGETPRAMFGRPFLRRLRALLTPGAPLVVNLFVDRRLPERLHRLGRVFRVRAQRRVGENLVVHLA